MELLVWDFLRIAKIHPLFCCLIQSTKKHCKKHYPIKNVKNFIFHIALIAAVWYSINAKRSSHPQSSWPPLWGQYQFWDVRGASYLLHQQPGGRLVTETEKKLATHRKLPYNYSDWYFVQNRAKYAVLCCFVRKPDLKAVSSAFHHENKIAAAEKWVSLYYVHLQEKESSERSPNCLYKTIYA